MCIQLATYTSLSKGAQTYKNLIIEYRDMFIYSKTSTFRNNSGIPWDNWRCFCFTCCYRCSLGNHHSLWALARFILSLNCWLFCWFLLKSQKDTQNILSWKGTLWILLWNNSSTWTSLWGLQSSRCNHRDAFGQP